MGLLQFRQRPRCHKKLKTGISSRPVTAVRSEDSEKEVKQEIHLPAGGKYRHSKKSR